MPSLAALALAAALSAVPNEAASCSGNTREIERCLSERLAKHEANLATYVAAARERIRRAANETPKGVSMVQDAPSGFDAAETAWWKYRDTACEAVYAFYSTGSIRGIKSLKCRMILTQEHTRRVWSDYLSYDDGSLPNLAEPQAATFP